MYFIFYYEAIKSYLKFRVLFTQKDLTSAGSSLTSSTRRRHRDSDVVVLVDIYLVLIEKYYSDITIRICRFCLPDKNSSDTWKLKIQ